MACPADCLLAAACDYILHDPSAAVEAPDEDIHNALPFDAGAFAVPGEDRSFDSFPPCHRKAL